MSETETEKSVTATPVPEEKKTSSESGSRQNSYDRDRGQNTERSGSERNQGEHRSGGYRPNRYRDNSRQDGDGEEGGRRGGRQFKKYRKKVCRFCTNKDLIIDYKNTEMLERFITERGKILPRRITGTCAKHQRILAKAIKQSRSVSLLPYTVK